MTATLAAQAEPIPGYRLIERIGRGGFGEVWKCEAPGGFFKAIKLVYGNLEDLGDDGKGAEQERKALERIKQIRHPFLLSLERFDIVDGQLRIVMELAEGSLWDRLRECRSQSLPGIPREELLRYMAEAAEVLDIMNQEHNLQHLDVKPQNLFLIHNHVKVADFGLVKVFEGSIASVTGGVTPVYAAPETFDGRATRFSDQYSLAIVYQELLTGVRPFNGANTRQLVLQHLTNAPNLAPLPEYDRGPVGRALAKSEHDRFPTCAAFVAALGATTAAPANGAPATKNGSSPQLRTSLQPTARSILRPSQMISKPVLDPTSTQQLGLAVMTMPRPADVSVSAPLPELSYAPLEETGTGVLLPAVVIGIGAVGDRVVRYLRRGIAEQFGGPDAVPQLRLLTLDTDPSVAGDPLALHLRLFRPSHYLAKFRDTGLEWLPPGLLYRLPRNPVTTGLRGLGRLAFWDHVKEVEKRLKTELEAALKPSALNDTANRTGLGIRTNRPRVYIVVNPGGGTGGGMFLDVAYLARYVLRRMGYRQPDVVGVLLLPPGDKSGTKPAVLANTFAALTELAHFSRPDTAYDLRLGPQPPVHEVDRPFGRCLCLPLPPGSDATARRLAAGMAAGMVFRDVLAPLGRAADESRPAPSATAFCHTAATYRLSWPGRRLARVAARHLAARLIQSWLTNTLDTSTVAGWLDEQWEARQLAPELLIDRLKAAAEAYVGGPPDDRFDAIVAGLSAGPFDARGACEVLNELAELAGKPAHGFDDCQQPGGLQRAIAVAAAGLTAEYDQKLSELAFYFIELPRHRIAAAEEVVRQITERLRRSVETYESLAKSLNSEAAGLYAKLFPLIRTLDTTAPSKRSSTEILEPMRAFAKKHYQALLAGQVLMTFRSMVAAAPEYLRDINVCRRRLTETADLLATAGDNTGGPSPFGPGRELFPGGRRAIDEAAADFAAAVSADELDEIDHRAQTQVRTHFRAVITYCLESTGSPAPLADLVREQAERFLAERSGGESATAVFSHFAADPQAAHRAAAEAYDEAGPTLAAEYGTAIDLLAVPDGPAGEEFHRIAVEAVPTADLLPVESPDEVVFYRELADIAVTDLPQLGPIAKEVYETQSETEHEPHARGDIDWKPASGA
jgi:serine/threonine protein kinase